MDRKDLTVHYCFNSQKYGVMDEMVLKADADKVMDGYEENMKALLQSAVEKTETIQKQEVRIKELEASQSKWVSIQDHLPEKDCYVLISSSYTEDTGNLKTYVETANFFKATKEFVVYDCSVETNVTHWMELPESPKNQ